MIANIGANNAMCCLWKKPVLNAQKRVRHIIKNSRRYCLLYEILWPIEIQILPVVMPIKKVLKCNNGKKLKGNSRWWYCMKKTKAMTVISQTKIAIETFFLIDLDWEKSSKGGVRR